MLANLGNVAKRYFNPTSPFVTAKKLPENIVRVLYDI